MKNSQNYQENNIPQNINNYPNSNSSTNNNNQYNQYLTANYGDAYPTYNGKQGSQIMTYSQKYGDADIKKSTYNQSDNFKTSTNILF